jgi:PST family polysaccharide transporter/lipopolysaccharide exporter
LTPEEFGLVGVVTLAVFAGMMASEFGVESAVIQRADLSPRFVQTAWTLLAARGIGLFLLLQAAAPWVAEAFGRPDAEGLLRLGAVSALLVNWPAVPAALLLREMRFRERAVWEATRDLVGTIAAVALSLWRGDAWALLIGLLLGQAVGLVQMRFLHGFRPNWTWDREAVAFYWTFGRHLYVGGLLTYVVTKGDDITVGKLRGIEALGQYQVVFGIAEVLTRGLTDVVSKVVFPAYARLRSEGRQLVGAFEEVWGAILLLLLPIVALSALFHESLVKILLGAPWLAAALPFALLVAAEALRALASVLGVLILAGGRVHYLSRIKIIETVCFCLTIVPLTRQWGMTGAALCLILVYGVSLLAHGYGAQLVEPVLARAGQRSWEPCLAAVVWGALIWWLSVRMGVGTPTGLALWTGGWGGYLWLRHKPLLIMLWSAVKKRPQPV